MTGTPLVAACRELPRAPKRFEPQQAAAPPDMIPQACRLPADTTVNVNPPVTFDGEVTFPPRTLAPSPIWPSAFEPQQYTAALLTPQVNPSPALSSVNVR